MGLVHCTVMIMLPVSSYSASDGVGPAAVMAWRFDVSLACRGFQLDLDTHKTHTYWTLHTLIFW